MFLLGTQGIQGVLPQLQDDASLEVSGVERGGGGGRRGRKGKPRCYHMAFPSPTPRVTAAADGLPQQRKMEGQPGTQGGGEEEEEEEQEEE